MWRYPRFRAWEYAAGALTTGALVWIEVKTGPGVKLEGNWTSGILFDDAARKWLRGSSSAVREGADRWSGYSWHPVAVLPILDGVLVPLFFDAYNLDVAWQLTMLNWQAVTSARLASRTTQLVSRRSRPSLVGCSDAPGSSNPCSLRGPAFISGHVAETAVGAGLTCAHHAALPLYGAAWADGLVCSLAVASTLVSGTLRIVADKHWASDVLAGAFVGGGLGFGMPWLLHYQSPLDTALPGRLAVVPIASENVAGVGLVYSE